MPFLAGRGQSSRGYFGGGTVPDAPTGLSSVPSNSQLTVSFTPPAFDGGLAITNYEYSINAGSTWMAISPADTTSPVAITGLTNGTTYTVYLRAVNPLGSGASSIALSTGTTPFTGPTAPTLLSSTPGNTQLAISFTAPSDNGGFAITNYEYALSTNSGTSYGSWTALSPTDAISPVTIPGLTNGTAYWVKLRAITSAAIGTESDPATTNTMPFTTPTAPTSLSSTAGNTQLAIAFTAPTSSGGPPITNYEYALSTNSGGSYASWVALSPADALTPVTITGLINGTAYYVKLRASTDFAKGAESLAVTTNTMPFTAPAPPTGLASSAGDGQLYISFTAGSSGGPPITNYQYALSTNSGSTYSAFTALSPADATSPITISGLTNGQAYYVKLRTVTSLSTSLDSDAVFTNTTPYTVASAPTIGTIAASISSPNTVSKPTMGQDENNATFTWSNPGAGGVTLTVPFTAASNGGSDITDYQYSTDNGATFKSSGRITTPVTITIQSGSTAALAADTEYNIKLRAVTSLGGNGTASSASMKRTLATLTKYKVQLYNAGVASGAEFDSTSTSYSKSHYQISANWSVKVKAVNDNGDGPASAESDRATGWTLASCTVSDATDCDSCGTKTKTCSKWTRNVGGVASTDGACDVSCGAYGDCSDSWVAVTTGVSNCVYAIGVGLSGVSGYYDWNFLGGGWIRYTNNSCTDAAAACGGGSGLVGTDDLRRCSLTGAYRAYNEVCNSVSCC